MHSPETVRKELALFKWSLACLLLVSPTDGRATERRLPRVPSVSKNLIFSEPTKPIPGPEKNYTGIRVKQDSILLLYHHEQTVAVVEVAPNRAMFNCELLEVRTKADKQVALSSLKAIVPTQIKIAFSDMMDLMSQCQKLDSPLQGRKMSSGQERQRDILRVNPRQLSSLFSIVFPGTKWCGAGDIASSYHDLGSDKELDKCCRMHDLCPVKVSGFRTQYNLTNYSPYTRSHCLCDDFFYNCLKSISTTSSNFLGNVYFNVAPVTCVEDLPHEDPATKLNKQFVIKGKRY